MNNTSEDSHTTMAGRAAASRISRRGLLHGGALAAAGLGGAALIGCGGDDELPSTGAPAGDPQSAGDPQPGGGLRIATVADNFTLDPPHLLTYPDLTIAQHAYDNLVQEMEDLSIRSMLAESFETEDLQTWTFNLRPGVKFQHGKDFTADDVVFTIERMLDPDEGSPARTSLSSIQRVERVDDLTVRMVLDSPNAFLPSTLSLYQGRVTPSDVDPAEFARRTFGTGPFSVQQYEPGERAILQRNPEYWGNPLPYLDQLTFFFIPEPTSRAEAIRAASADVVFPLESQQALGLQGDQGIDVSEVASAGYLNIAMFCDRPPFNDPRVRQALQAVMDRDTVREAALFGAGENANDHPIPPNDPMWLPDQDIVQQDYARATQLLDAAGHGQGMTLTLHTSTVVPGMQELAVTFRELAAPVGVNVEIQRAPEDAYWSTIWLAEPFLTAGWNGRNPDEALNVVYKSEADWNESNYYNPDLDRMIDSARGIADESERREAYGAIQRLLTEEVPRLIPVFRPIFTALRSHVRGLSAHPRDWLLTHETWLDA